VASEAILHYTIRIAAIAGSHVSIFASLTVDLSPVTAHRAARLAGRVANEASLDGACPRASVSRNLVAIVALLCPDLLAIPDDCCAGVRSGGASSVALPSRFYCACGAAPIPRDRIRIFARFLTELFPVTTDRSAWLPCCVADETRLDHARA
jgi:hypothetical protein